MLFVGASFEWDNGDENFNEFLLYNDETLSEFYRLRTKINNGSEPWPVEAIFGKWSNKITIAAVLRNFEKNKMLFVYIDTKTDDGARFYMDNDSGVQIM